MSIDPCVLVSSHSSFLSSAHPSPSLHSSLPPPSTSTSTSTLQRSVRASACPSQRLDRRSAMIVCSSNASSRTHTTSKYRYARTLSLTHSRTHSFSQARLGWAVLCSNVQCITLHSTLVNITQDTLHSTQDNAVYPLIRLGRMVHIPIRHPTL